MVFVFHGLLGGRFYGTGRPLALLTPPGGEEPRIDPKNNWTREGSLLSFGRNYMCSDCMFQGS